jgi:hypothetical protein
MVRSRVLSGLNALRLRILRDILVQIDLLKIIEPWSVNLRFLNLLNLHRSRSRSHNRKCSKILHTARLPKINHFLANYRDVKYQMLK